MDHGADRQIVLHDALGAVAQVRADVARDVGRGLIIDLSSGGCGQGPDQRDQRGRTEALRKAGVDKAGGAGAAELVATKGADLDCLVVGQDDAVPGHHDSRLRERHIGAVTPHETRAARDQDARAIERMDVLGDDGTDRAGQRAVQSRLGHGLDHRTLHDRVAGVHDHLGLRHCGGSGARADESFVFVQARGLYAVLSVGPCPHPGKRYHGRGDAFGPRFGLSDPAAFKFGEPQILLVRAEVRGRGWGQTCDLEIRAQLVELAVAFGQLPFERALRLSGGLLQRRDLRCEIGNGLLRAAVRCLDGPRAQVFEFSTQRGKALH